MNDHQQILNVFHKTAVIKLLSADRALDVSKTARFCMRLEKCLMSSDYYDNRNMGPIIIVLDPVNQGTGHDLMMPVQMGELLKSGASKKHNIVYLDYDGKIIALSVTDNIVIDNPADACGFSLETNASIFFILNNELNIFSHGRYVDCIPNIHSLNKAKKISDAALPVSDYRKLVTSHYKERICKDTTLSYWQNKGKRLLVAGPERIFGHDLANYLDDNIADGHVDIECFNAWTNDRTDIRVLKYEDGKMYIIEVKWLGKSMSYKGSFTEYNDDRANEGIVQLNDYLRAENQAICGVLIIYDSRKEDSAIKWNTKITRDVRIEDPIKLFLISESASERAKRIVKEYKKA